MSGERRYTSKDEPKRALTRPGLPEDLLHTPWPHSSGVERFARPAMVSPRSGGGREDLPGRLTAVPRRSDIGRGGGRSRRLPYWPALRTRATRRDLTPMPVPVKYKGRTYASPVEISSAHGNEWNDRAWNRPLRWECEERKYTFRIGRLRILG